MNEIQIKDAMECEQMAEQGKDKDCSGCSCNVCIAQQGDDPIEAVKAREGWPVAIKRVLAAEEELVRIRLGMGDDYGDDPIEIVKALRAENERLREALIEIADAPEKSWKPMQAFRTDEQVVVDDAFHEGVIVMADIARNALGLPEWRTLEQFKQGTARAALGGVNNVERG